jgi:hypothetical protein
MGQLQQAQACGPHIRQQMEAHGWAPRGAQTKVAVAEITLAACQAASTNVNL